jgi:NAD(P)H-flavin reductase
MQPNPYLIHPAVIVDKKQEPTDIVTFRLEFTDPTHQASFRFEAGQFNMLYEFGVGEVAISIGSDPDAPEFLDHTIRIVGRVTQVLGSYCNLIQIWLIGHVEHTRNP